MSQQVLTRLGRTVSVTQSSEPPGPAVEGNAAGTGVSSLPNTRQISRTGSGRVTRDRPQQPRAREGNARGNESESESIRIASLNVGTMKKKSSEVVETMERRRIDICCLQETRWRGGSARLLQGKEAKYKFHWSGNDKGLGGVGILTSEKWITSIFEVKRPSDRIIHLILSLGEAIISIISVYAPQTGRNESEKDDFYDDLLSVTTSIPPSEIMFICGDLNGHVGEKAEGYEGIHGGHGFGTRNTEGERILEFANANNLVVSNSFFAKRESHLITYTSGAAKTQIDFILVKKRDQKLVKNIKCIVGEECASQHKLLVADLRIVAPKPKRRKFIPKCRIWKLRQEEVMTRYKHEVSQKFATMPKDESPDDIWESYKSSLKSAAETACGMSKNHNWRKESWWWNEEVDNVITEKRKAWKEWKQGGSREEYNRKKREAKKAVYQAKRVAEDTKFAEVTRNSSEIFRIARQMRDENQDVVGDKPVFDDAGNLCVADTDKMRAWEQHYEKLCNIEFPWDEESLPAADPVEGPPIYITLEMVAAAVKKLKSGKSGGPSGVVGELIKACDEGGMQHLCLLINSIVKEYQIPTDWSHSYLISLFKGKGSALERGNHRGLKLIEHPMKVLERIIETLIRKTVDIDAMQFGFCPGRGTTDAIFILRQVQEKLLAKGKTIYFAFVDLEKAFDRVPRKVLWWALRTVGVEEWIVRVVIAMYENASSKVRINDAYSNSVKVNVGVHQGSVLSPLLFIIVLEALSREFRTGCPWELLYADDLVIADEDPIKLEEKLCTWKRNLESRGLRVNMGKTKMMISGPGLETLKDSGKHPCGVCRKGTGSNAIFCEGCSHWVHHKCSGVSGRLIEDPSFRCRRCLGTARAIDARPATEFMVGDESVDVVDSFCYLGDTLCAGGGCSRAVTTRVRCAWGKFRELLPLLTTNSISWHRKGHLYNACVRSVMLHASECWAPTKKDTDKICRTDRSMLRWICKVSISDRVRIDSLLQKLALQPIETLMRASRLRWYGHVSRSSEWINQVTTLRIDGPVARGRPKITWREVVNEDRRKWGMMGTDPANRLEWRRMLRLSTKTVEPATSVEPTT